MRLSRSKNDSAASWNRQGRDASGTSNHELATSLAPMCGGVVVDRLSGPATTGGDGVRKGVEPRGSGTE